MCFTFLFNCIGRIDRYLYPLFRADPDVGCMTMNEAKELLQELYINLHTHANPKSDRVNFSAESHFAIGGYLPDHSDGFNELSRLIVDSFMEMPINKPQITLRRTKNCPLKPSNTFWTVNGMTRSSASLWSSDEPRLPSFMKHLELSREDACSYTMVGCNEP